MKNLKHFIYSAYIYQVITLYTAFATENIKEMEMGGGYCRWNASLPSSSIDIYEERQLKEKLKDMTGKIK